MDLEVGQTLKAGSPLFAQVLRALDVKGDAYLKIVKKTYNADGESSEGFHPTTGKPVGPENLTWNWAEWFRAIWARRGPE